MNKKPRIAFCFSWQARTLDQTYQLFQKNLFDAAKEQWFDYDMFCAVEDDEDVDKVSLLHPTKVGKIKSSDVEKIINKTYWDFIDNILLNNYWYTWLNWSTNVLQQLYKIQESIHLKQKFEKDNNIKYDIAFKLRFDCAFLRILNFKKIYTTIINGNKIVICNKQKMIPSEKFLIKIEDFYFIMDNETNNILWNIYNQRKKCFEWHEIKNKKLNRFLCNLYYDRIYNMPYNIFSIFIWLIFLHIYSLLFWYFWAEMQFLNYFNNNWVSVKKTYISIWWFKNQKKYKLFDFRTHSKTYLYKKSIYEL